MSQDDMWAPSGTRPLLGDDERGSDSDMERRRGSLLPYTGADGRSTNTSVYGGVDDERGGEGRVPPTQPAPSYIDPLEALLASPMPPPPPPFPKRQAAQPNLLLPPPTNKVAPPPPVLTSVDLAGRGSAAQDPTSIIRRLRSTIVGKEKELVALSDQLSELEGRLHEREMDHIKKDAAIKRLDTLREAAEGREEALKERVSIQEARIVELEALLNESKVKTEQVEAAARVLMEEVELARTTAHFRMPTTATPQLVPAAPHRADTPPPSKVSTPRATSKSVGTGTPPLKKPKTTSSPTQTKAPSTTKDASTLTDPTTRKPHPSSSAGGTLHDPSPEYLWATSAAVVLRYYEGVIATQLDEGYEYASLLDTYLGIKEQCHIDMLQQVGNEERLRYERRVAALQTPQKAPATASSPPPSHIRAELDALRAQLIDSEEQQSALTNQILLADETIHSMKAALQETAQARDTARVSAADYRHEVQRLSMIIANTCTDGVHEQHSRDSVMEIVKETALKSLRKEIHGWKAHVGRVQIAHTSSSGGTNPRTDVNKSMSSAVRESALVMRALIDEQRAKQGKPTTAPSSRSASHQAIEKAVVSLPPTRQFPTVSTAPVTPRHVNTGVTNAGVEDPEVAERMRVALLQRIDDLCSPDRDRRARVVREYKGWMESTETLVMDASAEASTTPRSQRPGWR